GAVASGGDCVGGVAATGAADGDAAPGGGIGYPQAEGPGTAAYRCARPADTRSFVFPTIQKNITYPTSAKPGGRKTPATRSGESRERRPDPFEEDSAPRIRGMLRPVLVRAMMHPDHGHEAHNEIDHEHDDETAHR